MFLDFLIYRSPRTSSGAALGKEIEMITRQMKHVTDDGQIIEVDIGAEAKNVETDAQHQFVTTAEKEAIQASSEAVQGISGKIGAAGDTGGSTTAGTVMGKLNKLISDVEAAAENPAAYTNIKCGSADSEQEITFAFREINTISNDDTENDLTITLYDTTGASAGQFIIKPDETLNNVGFAGSKIGFAGTSISARYILLG